MEKRERREREGSRNGSILSNDNFGKPRSSAGKFILNTARARKKGAVVMIGEKGLPAGRK
jgi:hypothetical protein